MNVFVTGGTGMVGANLARQLVAQGHCVRLLLRQRRHPFLAELPYESVPGDLDDVRALTRGMSGCRHVYHVAGLVSYRPRDRARLYETNVAGTRNVLAAAAGAGVERVLHTSSTAAVGMSRRPHDVLDESASFDRRFEADPYMWTKHLAEEEVARAVERGLDVIIVNPSTIYGGGDVYGNTSGLLPNLRRGRVLAAPPGGNSVVSVDDVVRGMLLAMERGRAGRRYILSAERMTYHDMLNRAAAVVGGRAIRWTIPTSWEHPLAAVVAAASALAPALPLSAHVVRFSFRYRYFSAARAAAELGWVPRTSFEDAVRAALRFLDGRND